MFAVRLPILPFLIERLAGTADAVTLSQHTGLLTSTYVLVIFPFTPVAAWQLQFQLNESG